MAMEPSIQMPVVSANGVLFINRGNTLFAIAKKNKPYRRWRRSAGRSAANAEVAFSYR
jgi:hypothetical protein